MTNKGVLITNIKGQNRINLKINQRSYFQMTVMKILRAMMVVILPKIKRKLKRVEIYKQIRKYRKTK
jgi:hypothetical protein